MHTNDPDSPEQPPYRPSPSDEQVQPRKKVPRWLQILIAALVLFSAGASAYSYLSSVLHDPVPGIVNQYYTAIKSQDYTTAYQYLGAHQWDPSIKSNPGIGADGGWGFPGAGDFMTQSQFIQAAQNADTTQGKVRNFKLDNTYRALNSNSPYRALASVTVTRNGTSYTVKLNIQQIGGTDWKIVGFDNL